MEFQYKTGYTHAGRFHADDVFSAAFLKILNPEIKIHRVFNVPQNIDKETTIVFDIGRGEFDHHQNNSRKRENGVPYAAFGLLWERFGSLIFEDPKMVQKFDDNFIQALDLNDNTGDYNQLAELIGNFNPLWNEDISIDKQFEKAVDFADMILRRIFSKRIAGKEAYSIVKKAYEESDGKIVILKKYAPWKNALIETDAFFVIFPSNRGGYSSIAIQKSDTDNSSRIPFPESWAALEDEALEEVSGIKGLIFCHKNRFMVHTLTLEAAKKAAETALNLAEEALNSAENEE